MQSTPPPNNLRAIRERAGLSRPQLATRLKSSHGQVAKLERGERQLTQNWLRRLATALHCKPADFLIEPHLGNTPDLPAMPSPDADDYMPVLRLELRPGMGGGGYEDLTDATPILFPRRLIRDQLGARPEDMRAVEVEGPSMLPMLESGDQVLVNVAKRNPSQPGIFCLFDGFGIVCKLVERVPHSSPPRVRVISANRDLDLTPAEYTEDEAHIIGRVVWFARRL